jgi:ribulose kinase
MGDLDMSSVVETVAWYFVGVCAVAVAARSIIKARIIRHVGADDVFIRGGLVRDSYMES